jgi:hypothetical protein
MEEIIRIASCCSLITICGLILGFAFLQIQANT